MNSALYRVGAPPKRVNVALRGEVAPMTILLSALRGGLVLSVVAIIFLLLVANFQSWQLALVTIASVPAVIAGVVLSLWLTGTRR